MRLHPSVLAIACSYEECGSARGVPCRTKNGYVHYVHNIRRIEGVKRMPNLEFVLGVVATIEK